MDWISTKNSKPENDEDVFICLQKYGSSLPFAQIGYYKNGEWYNSNDLDAKYPLENNIDYYTVTFYAKMEFPKEAYKN